MYDETFEIALQFATDCQVEVEAQLYPMKRWNGDYDYGRRPLELGHLEGSDLDEDSCAEIVVDLSQMVEVYETFIENVQDLLSASQDTLKGLAQALEFAENFEPEQEDD